MTSNKIGKKLTFSFVAILFIFSLVIGVLFTYLFTNHTVKLNKIQMENRAKSVARIMTSFYTERPHRNGHDTYLRFIGDLAGKDVWIVDTNHEIITSGLGIRSYNQLPENAEKLIESVFENKTVFSEDFNIIFSEPVMTVGTPIIDKKGNVTAAVLLHSSIDGIHEAILQGFKILILSILTSMVVGIILSFLFAKSFSRPISIMEQNAFMLMKGEYAVRNNIKKNDELGQLGSTLDILAKQLETASQQEEKLNKLRQDFVANVSHELKTPVTVLRGSLEALVEGIVKDEELVSQYHLQMLQETIFLQRLVGDLLDLSKLQNADFPIDMYPMVFQEVLLDTIRSIEPLAKEKNITVHKDISKDMFEIVGDYGRLRQMLLIILNNAVKFSTENGEIKIILANNKLLIKNTGSSILEEDIPYIFHKFYKARNENNKEGTGLGLAIAKEIALRHKMDISARNTLKGVMFILSF
ncbi:MAG: sensor histidine kinase [Anaerotignaceae bacterium]